MQNVEKYEKLLVAIPPKSIRGDGLRRPASNYLRTRDTYERLCQTQGSQVFTTNNHSVHMLSIMKISGQVNMTTKVTLIV